MHAAEFLKQSGLAAADVPPVVAVHGDQRLLARRCVDRIAAAVLGDDDEPTRLDGETADLASALDELRTVSMFASARIVTVTSADRFVSDHRAGLERYVAAPAAGSVLILEVSKWPKTTRLAKAVAKSGLTLECTELKGAKAAAYLVGVAKSEYGTALARDAAELMVTLAGTDLGLLEQELGKLCAFAADRDPKAVTAEDVATLVMDGSVKNTFEMLAEVRRGNVGGALAELDKLLLAGEAPFKILGGMSFVLRKTATAVDLSAADGNLSRALATAGVFPKERGETEQYLRRLGRKRAERFRGLLLEADGALRGGSALPDRTVLERLLVQLAPTAR
ncbi:DNA polymerase III subunit delta [Alienimonas sp. DA493]|uniref:DNA polymerase III subunit delta n=1 Tax=Alienimonas sp. DA493 TaxID=3373605 RepID=UPI0037550BCA